MSNLSQSQSNQFTHYNAFIEHCWFVSNVPFMDLTSEVRNQDRNSSLLISMTAFMSVNRYAEWLTIAISSCGRFITKSAKNP
mmetsp:Transcript_3048/g.4709  ORF Transcript_3048/g.4709 Transcript_3048/m.4709 type:complete len:82 (-) Transcript_3048:1012-1257(-)